LLVSGKCVVGTAPDNCRQFYKTFYGFNLRIFVIS
jgi:hypothetical protein